MPAVQRGEQPWSGDERRLLTEWLEFQRATLAMKCEGLAPDQLATRSAPPSTLTLARLLRHLADTERAERQVLLGEDIRLRYDVGGGGEEPEGGMYDFGIYDVDDDALAVWQEECAATSEILAGFDSFDDRPRGEQYAALTVRPVVLHLLMEYARHNGHADMLREHLDGRVGY